ncbi:DUF4230 domain-containing protein [Streptacidiphilus sp. PB12-B1b]|uniref:DUF4230 domain-containing protein n=1 Tax=Streptacidiphilus sp. PB12-B1b TaxID=2705012 RepID=UPI0015F9DF6A|nr:DUF4230 domain-containing protein [Streptacidiphilus sp. PB12-B1b]QMU75991.1 DUF4230 domain-containing protein [Streptacidiphilus sp. PB12-B1b]
MRSQRGTANGTRETAAAPEPAVRQRPPARRVPWYISIPVTFAVIVALFLAAGKFDWLPGLPNPFATSTVDRSQPAVLQSIENMSNYNAATGNFQIVINLQQEAAYLPSALLGSDTLYVAGGTVESYVNLGKATVKVSADRRTATIVLPPAQLGQTALNPKETYVFAQNRGLFNRIGDFFSGNPDDQQKLSILAASKIQTAASASGLTQRAQQNTTAMLSGLLRSLGFTSVTVSYT